MLVKNIIFPTSLEKIEDIKNDNIDIFVELENGWTYTMVVTTPLNLLSLMKKVKLFIICELEIKVVYFSDIQKQKKAR